MAIAPLMPGTLIRYAMELDEARPDDLEQIAARMRAEAERHTTFPDEASVNVNAEYFDQLMHRSSRMFALEARLARLTAAIDGHNSRLAEGDTPFRVPSELAGPCSFPEHGAPFPGYIEAVLEELPEALDVAFSSDDEEEVEQAQAFCERVHNAFTMALSGAPVNPTVEALDHDGFTARYGPLRFEVSASDLFGIDVYNGDGLVVSLTQLETELCFVVEQGDGSGQPVLVPYVPDPTPSPFAPKSDLVAAAYPDVVDVKAEPLSIDSCRGVPTIRKTDQ